MKERPILFTGDMVRAILEGRKTQTRRIVKPVRGYEHHNICSPDMADDSFAVWWHGKYETVGCLQECPYGKPGDSLWIREIFHHCFHGPYGFDVIYDADGERVEFSENAGATDAQLNWLAAGIENHGEINRPSIHMPRWASRITLEITGVRVERLQDISEDDAKAEGAFFTDFGKDDYGQKLDGWRADRLPNGANDAYWSARHAFGALWESINGLGSWNANPWVWVVEFQRIAP